MQNAPPVTRTRAELRATDCPSRTHRPNVNEPDVFSDPPCSNDVTALQPSALRSVSVLPFVVMAIDTVLLAMISTVSPLLAASTASAREEYSLPVETIRHTALGASFSRGDAFSPSEAMLPEASATATDSSSSDGSSAESIANSSASAPTVAASSSESSSSVAEPSVETSFAAVSPIGSSSADAYAAACPTWQKGARAMTRIIAMHVANARASASRALSLPLVANLLIGCPLLHLDRFVRSASRRQAP